MPYKYATDHIKLPRDKDRRVKLSDEEREYIKKRYKEGETIRGISRAYPHVSRRLIQFVIFPERKDVVVKRYKERGQAKTSYAKNRGKKWAEIMREHRRYKQKVLHT